LASDDERRYIVALCEQEGIRCHYSSYTPEGFAASQLQDFTVEPTDMVFREQPVQQQAVAAGERVLLSGWGGDEVVSFNGRGYYAELFLRGRWLTLHRRIAGRGTKRQGTLQRLRFYARMLHQKVVQPLIPDAIWALSDANRVDGRFPFTVIDRAFAARHHNAMAALRAPNQREIAGLHTMQGHLLDSGHIPHRMEAWTTSGAAYGLIYRYPLLDRRVLDFCLGTPPDHFLGESEFARYLFRAATAGILPDTIRWQRTKTEPIGLQHIFNVVSQGMKLTFDQIQREKRDHPAAQWVYQKLMGHLIQNWTVPDARISTLANALFCFAIDEDVIARPTARATNGKYT
jgi:asparagine synthase (glutamine-hydrolysing)